MFTIFWNLYILTRKKCSKIEHISKKQFSKSHDEKGIPKTDNWFLKKKNIKKFVDL